MININILSESEFCKNASNAIDYHSLPRFRWYSYKEGFSSKLVEEAINIVGIGNDDYVLDPFNGNGTVTLTASINNIKSIGIEVNPFVAFMSTVKLENYNRVEFKNNSSSIFSSISKGKSSNLELYSTFTEKSGRNKWLFNSEVLNSFEGGWYSLKKFTNVKRKLYQLALIGAAIDNCNAVKDGKCLKYRNNWQKKSFNKVSFVNSFENRLKIIEEDLEMLKIPEKAVIINDDARKRIKSIPNKFKLCITSPPYLNSFDYTDIYRAELFLGKFINSSRELKEMRYNTIRSHVEITLPKPIQNAFGEIYHNIYNKIFESKNNWSKQIPTMIQCYFEDMQNILVDLFNKAKIEGELWLVVANSVYVGIEIPVDLILAEIGTRNGWKLKRIEVLRYINRRKTKYNGDINQVRESLIVFHKA